MNRPAEPHPKTHNLFHPIVILCITVFAIILIATRKNLLPLIMLFLVYSTGFIALRVKLRTIISSIRYLLWMLPVTFLMHIALSQFGWEFLRSLFNGSPDFQALKPAVMFTLQIFGFIFVMGGIIQVIRLDRLLDGLYIGLQPLRKIKLPVDDFFQILFIGLRFFPLLREEAQRIQDVRRGFGVTGSTSLVGKIRSHITTAIPLFIGTLYRAETVAQTMTLRGYVPGNQRTVYTDVFWHRRDWVLLMAGFVFTGIVFVL